MLPELRTPHPIRIVIVDDHQHFHDAILSLLRSTEDIHVVGQVFRGEDALQLCQLTNPDLVMMDVVMPGMGGIETTKLLLSKLPHLKILVLSSMDEYEYIRAILDSGAVGYLLKNTIAQDLISSIRSTVQGNAVFSAEIAQKVLNTVTDAYTDFGLTERERQILTKMATGQTNAEIAEALTISQPTVRFHLINILEKMGVQTRSEALVLAAKHQLV